MGVSFDAVLTRNSERGEQAEIVSRLFRVTLSG